MHQGVEVVYNVVVVSGFETLSVRRARTNRRNEIAYTVRL